MGQEPGARWGCGIVGVGISGLLGEVSCGMEVIRTVWVDRHCCSADVVVLGQLEVFWGGWKGGKILVENFAPEIFGARWNVNSCLNNWLFLDEHRYDRFWNRVIEMGGGTEQFSAGNCCEGGRGNTPPGSMVGTMWKGTSHYQKEWWLTRWGWIGDGAAMRAKGSCAHGSSERLL